MTDARQKKGLGDGDQPGPNDLFDRFYRFSTQTVLICFWASAWVLNAAGPTCTQVVSVGRVSTTLHFFVACSWTM